MRSVLPLIILLIAIPAHAETLTRNVCPTEFRAASEGTCDFTAGGWSYALDSAGELTRRRGDAMETTRLQLATGDFVNDLLFAEHGGDVILIYGLSDNESGIGKVARLASDPFEIKWTLDFGGFNLSTGLIRDQFLYQAAIGIVGKIDLEKGEYIWRHERLYGRRSYGRYKAFNAFETPRLEGGAVLFPDRPYPRRSAVFVIRVDDDTGEISIDEPC